MAGVQPRYREADSHPLHWLNGRLVTLLLPLLLHLVVGVGREEILRGLGHGEEGHPIAVVAYPDADFFFTGENLSRGRGRVRVKINGWPIKEMKNDKGKKRGEGAGQGRKGTCAKGGREGGREGGKEGWKGGRTLTLIAGMLFRFRRTALSTVALKAFLSISKRVWWKCAGIRVATAPGGSSITKGGMRSVGRRGGREEGRG